jgi:sulfur-oxidizing protein SoxX
MFMLAAMSATAHAQSVKPEDVKIVDGAVEQSLTGAPGDAAEGRKIASSRKLGNCLACHVISDLNEELFHGEVGPPLDGVADRWNAAELRAILVNVKEVLSEDTIMPGFYTLKVGENVREDLVGKTILSAEQVENVVAYLSTLKE